MNCPGCKIHKLVEVLAKPGVLIDICPNCKGIWLDKGEIFYFTRTPTYLDWKIKEALKNQKPSLRVNPRTSTPLVELSLFEGKLAIDYCPHTQGIWLDKGEIEKLPAAKELKLKIETDKNTYPSSLTASSPQLVSLPNLSFASGITLFLLYALIIFLLLTLSNLGIIPPIGALLLGVGFAFFQFLLSPFIMDISLRWFYRLNWKSLDDFSAVFRDFLIQTCRKQNIKIPRIGIIPDGAPNAFTYGHTPNNARLVLTKGIIELLEPEEVKAVIAHEIGHIVHWDMLVMTVANLVPLILYYLYRVCMEATRDRGNSRGKGALSLIGLGSYILYIISEYVVLYLSRIREYFADRFSAETTEPGLLSSALVKIGYGLAGKEKSKEKRNAKLEAIKALGIFDPTSARALAIASTTPHSMGGQINKENLKGAMRWDLWNPWAGFFEINSTHPLIAKRLIALGRQAEVQGKEPFIRFNERKPESYWDEFFIDIIVASLPFLVTVSGLLLFTITGDTFFLKIGVFFLGCGYLLKTCFSYNFSYFPEMNISSLLKKVKVSGIRGVPCTVKGEIIGRGVPGLIWSEDFVLQDETGIIFLDYRQPLAIWNFLFGIFRARQFIGEKVKVKGWYRRSPVPYIEIKRLESDRGNFNCFVFNVKIIVAIILIGLGIFLSLI